MARLTVARKMAAIVLTIGKKGERFDPEHWKRQAAERLTRARSHPRVIPAAGQVGFLKTLGFEDEYLGRVHTIKTKSR
jgi:hypothetical protein